MVGITANENKIKLDNQTRPAQASGDQGVKALSLRMLRLLAVHRSVSLRSGVHAGLFWRG
ncbi:hypothetical protein ALP29_201605 [Pseudomonas syringae pv. avii]|uniref:Uncharacterized protein n=1 Tax=Pseudomonas syringae pv. avii TaxID=663959 RepID=A0A3M5U946_PSESX|nr:hypothetical protein ALP29_201605 [Pseudomonas syringae pv. avii]